MEKANHSHNNACLVNVCNVCIISYYVFLQLEETEDKAKVLDEYTKGHLSKRSMNKKNLKLFIECYMNRMDITGKLKSDLTCDALLVVGSKSSQSSAAEYMHSHMDKVKFNYKVHF